MVNGSGKKVQQKLGDPAEVHAHYLLPSNIPPMHTFVLLTAAVDKSTCSKSTIHGQFDPDKCDKSIFPYLHVFLKNLKYLQVFVNNTRT